jgi:solute:Na+ symporter, SSS family
VLDKIEIFDYISTLDWIVFLSIIAITIASILYGESLKKSIAKGEKEKERETFLDHLIMGRQLTLPLFIATLVATWYGGIFGVTKIAFEQGVFNLVTQGGFWYFSYIIFALFLVDKIAPYQAVTLPDLIGKMFGPKSRTVAAIFNLFNVLPIAYTISLGLFTQLIFGGELWVNMAIGVSVVVIYSIYGGLRAEVFSDLVQFFVMCIAVFIVLMMSIYEYGGLSFLQSKLEPSYFSATGSVGLGATLVWGFIALSTLVDPNFYQRCFAATTTKVAKKGIFISTIIWFCFDICTTFGAMYAKALIPNADSKSAYLTYFMQLLPDGLKGFVLAGILATIISTLDSYLILAGSTAGYDLAPKKWRGKMLPLNLGIITVGVLSIIMSFAFEGNIKTVWKTLGSYSAACFLIPVVMGYIFPRKISDIKFVCSCLFSAIAVTVWRSVARPGFWQEVDELYIGMLVSTLVLLPSLLRAKKTS